MTGLRRAVTSYDVYNDYDQDQFLDEQYQLDPRANGGALSPQMYGGRTTPADGRYTPDKSRYRSKSRPLGRPSSRVNVSVQDSYLPPLKTETQRNYNMPESPIRPTSPVQRLLDRSATQPFISLEHSAGAQMDPFTKQYYHRQWRSSVPSTELQLNRHGRAGGVWRHVRACVAMTGNHLAFIDGTVKQEDNIFFPAFQKQEVRHSFAGMPTFRSQPRTNTGRKPKPKDSVYSQHARGGFKYWYQEPKPIDYSAKYSFGAGSNWHGVPGPSLHPRASM